MKIYTKTGDDGSTSLIGGIRVPKCHLRIEICGAIDELNAYIGLLAHHPVAREHWPLLKTIQQQLFVIGAQVASVTDWHTHRLPSLQANAITQLEQAIDAIDQTLSPLKYFILPGGHTISSYCHIARCVCRRAERLVVHLSLEHQVNEQVIPYLNRLSDYLFVLARKINQQQGGTENIWSAEH